MDSQAKKIRSLVGIVFFLLALSGAASFALGNDLKLLRGIVRPMTHAAISVDISARVKRAPFREGQAFKKGDLIFEFDCDQIEAHLAGANASLREASLVYKSAAYLAGRGAGGKFDRDIAEAKKDRARADVAALASRLKQCTILAPFDGRVIDLMVRQHERSTPAKPIISLADETVLEVEIIVPSIWLRSLSKGTAFSFQVDELKQTLNGKISRFSSAVDPVSQTIKVFGTLDDKPENLLSGMTGTINIRPE